MLKIEHVTKRFEDGKSDILAVDDISLELEKGTFAAIVGPSGSGKSTLLTIMGALQKPSNGVIELDGVNIYDISEKRRSQIRFKRLGFVLQGSNLIPYLTVEEQFKLKLKKSKLKDKSIYESLFEQLKISQLRNKYPDEISGGERQRVAIALSLVLKPDIVLADEPTASLDTEKSFDVIKMLKEITKSLDTTVVMVTHDTRMLKECDRIFEIVDGKLKEEDITTYN